MENTIRRVVMNTKKEKLHLSAEQQNWVDETFRRMSVEDKIGQIFCISMPVNDTEKLREVIRRYRPGGFMFRPDLMQAIREGSRVLQETTEIPLLLAANLECGGNGLYHEGTFFGRNLEIAATDDEIYAYRQGYICGAEAGAVGVNWAFAPVVDIDYNWRNPITNVRTYGNDPDRVIRMGKAYMYGIRKACASMSVCIKHFPGDGIDERDQHLLPSVNSLTAEEWRRTYGRVYRQLIDEGAETLMVGHILQPALEKSMQPDLADREILPASLSRNLVSGVIRGKMGFDGLIVTDSTNMVGYTALKSRKEAIALSLMAGVDMILFCKDMEEDFAGVRESLRQGKITEERLDEAVLRQLTLKAAKGLNKTRHTDVQLSAGTKEMFAGWAYECAQKAVTLVKDTQALLPISPNRTKRIRLTVLGEADQKGAFGDSGRVTEGMKQELEKRGFEVSVYDYSTLENNEIVDNGTADMKAKFDLSIIVANVSTGSNYTSRRIDWIPFLAADCPWYVKDIPTMFISFCNPHHMIDVPFISTFINAYSANSQCIRTTVEKMTGEGGFEGINPSDVWCGNVWCAKEY